MNAPKLRFKEFNDKWKNNKLANLCSFSKGKELSKSDITTDGEQCILYGELYTKYGPVISKVHSKTHKNSETLVRANKFDILIPSSGETAIDIACASSLDVDNILIGGDLNILTPIQGLHGHFLSYQINGKRKNNLSTLAQGATVTHLYADAIKKLICFFPSYDEQLKISSFLQQLDKKILLQQEKIDLLKQQKKGFMQKIFNQELRFKDDNGQEFPEWELHPLDKGIASLKSGLSRKLSHLDIGIPVIRANNIENGQLDFSDIKYWYVDDPQGAETENYLVNTGDILINFINSESKMGTSAIVEKDLFRSMIYTTNILKMVTNEYLNNYFFYTYTQTVQYQNYIKVITKPAVNQASFTTVDFKAHSMQFPCIQEQIKIANFFKLLDSKINNQSKKLEELTVQKQAFMQRMFI